MNRYCYATLGSLGALAAGCGSSSDPGALAVQGLDVPSTMAVITATENPSPLILTASDFSAGSAFVTDEKTVYVYDPSMEALETVNSILCQIEQTGITPMVNQGLYTAQIDVDKCESGQQDDDSAGQSSGGSVALETWILNSLRSDNSTAQQVQIWVPEGPTSDDPLLLAKYGAGDMWIRVNMLITEGVSTANPFGRFALDFASIFESSDPLTPEMFGTLATQDATAGNMGFSFYSSMGDVSVVHTVGMESGVQAVAVQGDPVTEEGEARVSQTYRFFDNFGGGDTLFAEEYLIAFNATHMLRQKVGDAPVCLSRSTFNDNVWRYNLYNASGPDAGELVDMNGGFPLLTTDGFYGQASYWGLWFPDGVTVANGDMVTEAVYGSTGPGSSYEVVRAPGKLIKNTRNQLDLTDLDGVTFDWWDWSGITPLNFLVEYDTAGSQWQKIALWNDGTQTFDTLGTPVFLDVSALGYLGMWSQTLGGSVNYAFPDNFITYYKEEFITGADPIFTGLANGELELFGYVDCLDSAISQTDADNGNIYLPVPMSLGTPYRYVFDADDLTLYHDTDSAGTLVAAGLDTGVQVMTGPNTWGMRSGPLVLDVSGYSDVWDVWSETVFYTYETGHNEWNQFSALRDNLGVYVEFDAPIQFSYMHSTVNDLNGDATFDGQTFLLGYNGAGDLWGMPYVGVDLDGDGLEDRWYPSFSIEDGVVMGPTGTEYVVKATEIEQTLVAAPGQCGALDLVAAGALVLPDGSDYQTPLIGPTPTVTGPPAVVAGVVQGSGL